MRATLDRYPNTPTGFGRERAEWTLGRVASVLTGGVLALCSLGLIAVGGYLLSAATSNGGWLALGHGTYQTGSYAVAADPEDWGTATYALGVVDKVRIRVTPSDATTPVFVGMARPDDVQRYLGGVEHVTAHEAPATASPTPSTPGRRPPRHRPTLSHGPCRPPAPEPRRWSSTRSSYVATRSRSS